MVKEGSDRVESANEPLTYGWAIALGLLQGITEFLPVSSSGHLALAKPLFGGPVQPLAFDILLHLATLLVTIATFWRELLGYLRKEKRMIALALFATLPAAAVGFLFREEIEAIRQTPAIVSLVLLLNAGFLLYAETRMRADLSLSSLRWGDAFWIGVCQALAITPGVSRSGSTISSGIVAGLSGEDAVKFSFTLMIPAVLGAVLLDGVYAYGNLDRNLGDPALPWGPCLVGFGGAAASGWMALRGLISLARSKKLRWCALYCAMVGLAGLFYFDLLPWWQGRSPL